LKWRDPINFVKDSKKQLRVDQYTVEAICCSMTDKR